MQPSQASPLTAPPSPNAFLAGQDIAQVRLQALLHAREGLEGARIAAQSQFDAMPMPGDPVARAQAGMKVARLEQAIAKIDQKIVGAQDAAPAMPEVFMTQPPRFPQENTLPKDIAMLSAIFIVCVLMPLAVAISLRFLRRGAAKVAALPSDIAERLGRMESAIEATAIEVERIGEGQRYLTRVLGEKKADELLERPRPVAPYKTVTPH